MTQNIRVRKIFEALFSLENRGIFRGTSSESLNEIEDLVFKAEYALPEV
jgi:hypothetical protein